MALGIGLQSTKLLTAASIIDINIERMRHFLPGFLIFIIILGISCRPSPTNWLETGRSLKGGVLPRIAMELRVKVFAAGIASEPGRWSAKPSNAGTRPFR